ncbi:MAG: CHRD domain-containing protein [Phycisphaerae bacterium]|nr:CHRD domain-containing protein [Saprospiraceae bacterium]
MKVRSCLFSLLFSFILPNLVSAQGPNNRLLFVADLTGGQEVPSVTTAARGVATFLFSEDLSTITVHAVFSGLSGPITASHVHSGIEGISGPVFTNFSSNIDNHSLNATITNPVGFLAKALRKELYLNVHTSANPGGEIRGQLVLMTDVQYAAILNGLEEVPSVLTTATGVFRFTYFPGNTKGHYIASYNGLSGAATAAHIHNAATGVSGPVVTPLSTGLPNTYVGDLDFSALPADFLQKLKDKLLYVNVHTAANPGGEIRGQLKSLGPITFETVLNGDQETPPVTTSAIGTAVASLNPTLDSLTYFVSVTGLTPTAAHFHTGPAGTAGPVLVPLATPAPNFYTGTVAITPTQLANFLKGGVYVNVHTAANPGGEIRGQMESNLRRVYAFDLCGDQEVPSNNSPALGAAAVTVDHLNTNLSYLYIVDGLSGPASAAHIHNGAFGVSGSVLKPLNTPSPTATGVIQITGNDAVLFESDNTYINVHTAAFPGGEIRGQLRRAITCAENVGVHNPVISEMSVFPNPSSGQTEIRLEVAEAFEGQLVLTDLTGKIIRSENHTFTAGSQVLPVNLSALPVGLYVAQIRSTEHGIVASFKMVKE